MSTSPAGDIFGKTFACDCGRTHSIMPDRIVLRPRAVDELAEVCRNVVPGRRVLVLADERTQIIAADAAAAALDAAGFSVHPLIAADRDDRSPVCDQETKNDLSGRTPEVDLILAVGSGVISDLGKWIAFEREIPYVALATAASMNGYTSANVAPYIGGVKTLLRARPPAAVLADIDILRDAPYELTSAGLGDILAKSVSSADWRLNHLLFGDYFCRGCTELISDIEPLYLSRPEDIRDRTSGAISALFEALLLTGAAMTMAESSAPASGGEHLISHCLDMLAMRDGARHDLHGRQVGVGTIIAAELYQRVLAIETLTPHDFPRDVDNSFWRSLQPVVSAEYAAKLDRLDQAKEKLADKIIWSRIRSQIAPMLRPASTIRRCLKQAGAAVTAADIGCDSEKLLEVLLHSHEMRSRFTVLDLAILAGVMPSAAWEVVSGLV